MARYTLLGINSKELITQFLLLFLLFTWFQMSFISMNGLLDILSKSYTERVGVYAAYYLSYAIVSIGYSILSAKRVKTYNPNFWIFFAMMSSLILFLFTLTGHKLYSFLYTLFAGIALGLGSPYCLSYFADHTEVENRGRIGGVIFLLISLILPLLSFIYESFSLGIFSIFSVAWMVGGFLLLLLLKPAKVDVVQRNVSFTYILANKQFYLYFVAWFIFSFVDSFEVSILRPFVQEVFGEAFKVFMLNLSTIIMAFSIVIVGFLIDLYGRKRALIYGFTALGIAYACIGINPYNIIFWYFYFLINGVALGFFAVIFVFTIWGDISPKGMREKYYAVGSFPFFFMVFVRELLAPYVVAIPVSTAFSFASFFLFLAVIPLMYAPETLPEKEIRRRELRKYIEKAKKIREKYEREED